MSDFSDSHQLDLGLACKFKGDSEIRGEGDITEHKLQKVLS